MSYHAKCFIEIHEDMVQLLLSLEALSHTEGSDVENLVCGAPSGSKPSLFFNDYLFDFGF